MIRLPTVDSLVARLAEEAKRTATSSVEKPESSSQPELAEAFTRQVEAIFHLKRNTRGRRFDASAIARAFGESAPHGGTARLPALRLNMEVELLKLDACCAPQFADPPIWPKAEDLQTLRELANEAVQLIGKSPPSQPWKQMKRLDRYFPKLKCCSRVEKFLNRTVGAIPPRPYGELMSKKEPEIAALWPRFSTLLLQVRSGKTDHAKVRWLEFEPLLICAQNAKRGRGGQSPPQLLRRSPGTPGGPPETLALLSFLELDRADLLWTERYHRHFCSFLWWLQDLEASHLISKLQPFFAGTIDPVESWEEIYRESREALKRDNAASRKAQSRKNSAKKCDGADSAPL